MLPRILQRKGNKVAADGNRDFAINCAGSSLHLRISPQNCLPLPTPTVRWNGTHPYGDWRGGGESSHDAGMLSVSSFTVVDQLVSKFLDLALFPKLKQVVLIGHSSGGQLAQVIESC